MELLLPAGSLQSGLYALTLGADAIYFGMEEFSARKQAKNFSLDDARRLKSFADTEKKQIYSTLNTIIRESELPKIDAYLKHLALLQPDGVIVQDLGLLHLLQNLFPSIPLHASTQMAVHTINGAKFLRDLGVKRAVLARELTLQEVSAIHAEVPELELEVFIHGALCYSFSGACLASGMLLGRSANRGECGQICRTWFTGTAGEDLGFTFSMKDLALGTGVKTLSEAGITSLKVEGRMKSPEYSGEAARYYRGILEGEHPDPKPLRTLFARSTTTGWLGGDLPEKSSTARDFSGHRGIIAAEVLKKNRDGTCVVKVKEQIALHDGLMYLSADKNSSSRFTSIPFTPKALHDREGKRMVTAGPRAEITMSIPGPVNPGMLIWKISDHALNYSKINPFSIIPWKFPLQTHITINESGLKIYSPAKIFDPPAALEAELPIEKAKKPADVQGLISKIFSQSGDSLFSAAPLTLVNKTEWAVDRIFLPASRVKKARRDWFSSLTTRFEQQSRLTAGYEPKPVAPLPLRNAVSPAGEDLLPFIINPAVVNPQDIASDDSFWYLPLKPVMVDEQHYLLELKNLIERLPDNKRARIGLNNAAHLHWASKHPAYDYFLDIYLYAANHATVQFIEHFLGKSIAGYYWVEDAKGRKTLPAQLREILFPAGETFSPPLFISRNCNRKDAMECSCSGCSGNPETYTLNQGERNFTVAIRECITYLFLE